MVRSLFRPCRGAEPLNQPAEATDGFILVDAIVALVVAASALAAIYGLLSASVRSTASRQAAVERILAAQTACRGLALSPRLEVGESVHPVGVNDVVVALTKDTSRRLQGASLWRMDCRLRGDPAPAWSTYLLRGSDAGR